LRKYCIPCHGAKVRLAAGRNRPPELDHDAEHADAADAQQAAPFSGHLADTTEPAALYEIGAAW
jgi:hypothetical protein